MTISVPKSPRFPNFPTPNTRQNQRASSFVFADDKNFGNINMGLGMNMNMNLSMNMNMNMTTTPIGMGDFGDFPQQQMSPVGVEKYYLYPPSTRGVYSVNLEGENLFLKNKNHFFGGGYNAPPFNCNPFMNTSIPQPSPGRAIELSGKILIQNNNLDGYKNNDELKGNINMGMNNLGGGVNLECVNVGVGVGLGGLNSKDIMTPITPINRGPGKIGIAPLNIEMIDQQDNNGEINGNFIGNNNININGYGNGNYTNKNNNNPFNLSPTSPFKFSNHF